MDVLLDILLFGSAVVWIYAGQGVAKPNLHGIKFEEGYCKITSVETVYNWNDLPTCSCGESCSERYPCVTVWVSFDIFGHSGLEIAAIFVLYKSHIRSPVFEMLPFLKLLER